MANRVNIKDRHKTYTVFADVEVNVSIRELSSEDLIAELEARGDWHDPAEERRETLEAIATEIRRGDIDEALLLIDRALMPKWDEEKAALAAYLQAMGRVSA